MKTSDRLLEANAIGRCSSLLEQLNTRLAAGGRNWREKQQVDWQTLRLIVNQQIARQELTANPPKPEPDEQPTFDVSKRWEGELNNRPGTEHNP